MSTTTRAIPFRFAPCIAALVPILGCTGNVDYSQTGTGTGGARMVGAGSGGAGSSQAIPGRAARHSKADKESNDWIMRIMGHPL